MPESIEYRMCCKQSGRTGEHGLGVVKLESGIGKSVGGMCFSEGKLLGSD